MCSVYQGTARKSLSRSVLHFEIAGSGGFELKVAVARYMMGDGISNDKRGGRAGRLARGRCGLAIPLDINILQRCLLAD